MQQDQLFLTANCEKCSPEDIDKIWADGWRNFGTKFFRNQVDYLEKEEKWVKILPLRINLEKFTFRKNQLKVLRQNANTTEVRYQKIEINAEVEAMFQKHIERFFSNKPNAITDFLGENSELMPHDSLECALYDENKKLYATSYFGIGKESISSIYATFDTDFGKRSPGLHTLLEEIRYAQTHQKRYIYFGYAHDVPSHYDYKKQFNGLEFYDWQGNWVDFQLLIFPDTNGFGGKVKK